MTTPARVLVVADDLTGANATAAGFARAGMNAVTVPGDRRIDVIAEFASRFDVVVVSTDTRHSDPQDAAARVRETVRAGWPVQLVCKRVDTTLRGNLGAETAGALAAVAELSGRRAVALCAPAHPAAGRHTVDGTQLLYGKRLEETELARDARTPVRTSRVADRLGEQAALHVAHLPLSTVTSGPTSVRAALRQALDAGAELVVADALTEDHLTRVAAAAADLLRQREDLLWVAVDPGPGSVALAQALGLCGSEGRGPLLAVSGSATALTRLQLQRLVAERPVRVVRPVARDRDGVLPDVDATVRLLDDALASAATGDVVLLATALEDADVVRLPPAAAEALPRELGRIVRRVLEEHRVDGVFSTGGDVTAALLAELGGRGIGVEEEVVPLAVAGTIVGGPWDGMPVVTKGGLVGEGSTALVCIDHLARSAELRHRHVRTASPRTPL